MSTPRIVLWVLSISAFFVLMLMNLWTVPIIRADAGGLHIFDNRPFGYGLEDAKAILTALYEGDQAGLNLYLTLQRKLDTLFPTLFAIAMPWALWVMTDEWKKPFRIAVCLAGFIGPMCDLTENYFVAGLLRGGPEALTAEAVARASAFSVTKWVLDIIAGITFLFLSWNLVLQRWRGH